MKLAMPLFIILFFPGFMVNVFSQNSCDATLLNPAVEECFTLGVLPGEMHAACPDLSSYSYWLKFDASYDNPNYSLQIDGTSVFDQISVSIGHFDVGCFGNFNPYGDLYFCGEPDEPLLLGCLIPNHTTYILISSNSPINLCATLTQVATNSTCQPNSNCHLPQLISLSSSNTLNACVSGCTWSACPEYNSSSSCFGNSPVVWYSFTMPQESNRLYAQLTSNNISRPVIQVFESLCGESPIGSCIVGNEGSASVNGLLLSSGITYYIGIGSADSQEGSFNLCLGTPDANENICTVTSELRPIHTSLGSPLYGPYKPDEHVSFTFEYTFSSIDNFCQWTHAIVPILGEGWDLDYQAFGLGNMQKWSWIPQTVVTSKVNQPYIYQYEDEDGRIKLCHSYLNEYCEGEVLQVGTPMPAGFYWINQPGQCETDDLTDPNNTWGDPCTGCANLCTKEVSFILKTKGDIQPEEHPFLSADVTVFVFSDRQTGCWLSSSPNVCFSDHPFTFNASVEVEPEEFQGLLHASSMCGNISPHINISAIQKNRGKGYVWTPIPQSGIEGAEKGEGHLLRPKLINTTNQSRVQSFEIKSIKENNDTSGLIGTIDILLKPSFDLSIDPEDDEAEYCVGDTILLEANIDDNLNSGPYQYFWQNGSTGSTIEYPLLEFGTQSIQLFVENSTGCGQLVQFDITSASAPDMGFVVDYNMDGSANINIADSIDISNFTFLWSDGSTEPTLNGVEPGIYTLTVANEIGCEFTFDVEILACTLEVILDEQQDVACHGGHDGAVSILFEGAQGDVTFEWSDGNNQMSIDSLKAGTYELTAMDSLGCPASFQVTINQPDPLSVEIEGELLICQGDSISLCVAEGFDGFLWSTGDTSSCTQIFTPQIVSVEVQNESGCTAEQTVTVLIADTVETLWETTGEITCWYDTIQVCVTNYDIVEWSDGFNTKCREVTTGGTYFVNLVSPDGCQVLDSIFFDSPIDTLLLGGVNIQNESSAQLDGSIEVLIEGGLPPYQYSWYLEDIKIEGEHTELLTDLVSGSYFVSVTDDAECSRLFGPFVVDFTINTLEEDATRQIQIFPNPAKSEIQIRSTISLDKIEILDVLGKPVSSHPLLLKMDIHTIEMDNLLPGVYFIICYGQNNWKSVHKVIKQ